MQSKLALILFFASLSFAKITKNQFKFITKNSEKYTEEFNSRNDLTSNLILWVLNLNDDSLDFRRLCSANEEEKMVYKNVIAPAIKHYQRQHSTRVDTVLNESDDKEHYNDKEIFEIGINEIKHHILILMNKFLLSQIKDPATYFSDDEIANEKSLKLYIIGPYTSLIMTYGKLTHHYFITPPSPFPRWFYRDHKDVVNNGKEKYVFIPTDVQQEFVIKLLDVLKLYTSYPV